jgi:ATP-dependent Zn protease
VAAGAGSGGSGVAIVRNGRAAASYTGSPTITMAGSDFVYTFTGNGTITF